MRYTHTRESIAAAVSKPAPTHETEIGDTQFFDPWEDVIHGIYGSYASECDDLLIGALKAARDRTTFEFVAKVGFAGELMLYILAGHGLLEYGTSPRGGWPDPIASHLWQALIDKCEAYSAVLWRGGGRDATPEPRRIKTGSD